MRLRRVFWVLVIFLLSKSKFAQNADESNKNVSKFVFNLVTDSIKHDFQKTHDVVLLQIENEPKGDLFDQIAKDVGSLSVLLTVNDNKPLKYEISKNFPMIIVVTDVTDKVNIT